MNFNEKFKVWIKQDTIFFEDDKQNVISFQRYTGKYDSSTSIRNLTLFFRGFHIRSPSNYRVTHRPILEHIKICRKHHKTDEEVTTIFKQIKEWLKDVLKFATSNRYYHYTKYTFPSVYTDFSYKLGEMEEGFDLKTINQTLNNYLDLDKELKIQKIDIFECIKIFSRKFKLRKDIFRIVRDNNIYVNTDFLRLYFKDEEWLNKIILNFENNKYFEDYKHLMIRNDREYNHTLQKWVDKEPYLDITNMLSDNLKNLVEEYGYDLKSTIDQHLNYYGIYENFNYSTYLQYLNDYASMLIAMDVKKFKKFPKFLKSVHDIHTREYELFKKDFPIEVFKTKVNNKLQFTKTKKIKDKEIVEFMVIVPQTPQDLKNEGKNLSHCVGTYIERVYKGTTQVCFLRKEQDKSLVTIEIKNDRIVQAKGLSNRSINSEERGYLNEYAKHKGLSLRI